MLTLDTSKAKPFLQAGWKELLAEASVAETLLFIVKWFRVSQPPTPSAATSTAATAVFSQGRRVRTKMFCSASASRSSPL